MGFKKIDRNLSFADLALASSMDKNRSLSTLKQLDKVIDWSRVEACLMTHYDVGFSNEGADAYPPLMLFKCLLLQKWFRIPSDPELESQINDRISFKEFLQLPLHMPSPDHSTFSRFRARLSKKGMIKIVRIQKVVDIPGMKLREGLTSHIFLSGLLCNHQRAILFPS